MVQLTIINRILEVQKKDEEFQKLLSKVAARELDLWRIDLDGAFRCRNILCVPDIDKFKKDILDEAHKSQMNVHPRGTKMCKDLKRNFW